jgi:hypothetical protein
VTATARAAVSIYPISNRRLPHVIFSGPSIGPLAIVALPPDSLGTTCCDVFWLKFAIQYRMPLLSQMRMGCGERSQNMDASTVAIRAAIARKMVLWLLLKPTM